MSIPFTEHWSTQQSAYDGASRIAVGTDPAGLGLGELASRDEGRLYIAVFAGSQRTGGYGIRVLRVDRAADVLTVHAMFSSPAPNAFTIPGVDVSGASRLDRPAVGRVGARCHPRRSIGGGAGSQPHATIETLT